jgi:hypothetical protein
VTPQAFKEGEEIMAGPKSRKSMRLKKARLMTKKWNHLLEAVFGFPCLLTLMLPIPLHHHHFSHAHLTLNCISSPLTSQQQQ